MATFFLSSRNVGWEFGGQEGLAREGLAREGMAHEGTARNV